MKVTQLRIGLHGFNDSSFKKSFNAVRRQYFPNIFIQDENNYFAEAIDLGGQYFYRVDETTVCISQFEYDNVLVNPRLYYFSSALKLHHRIKKAKELGLGKDWPNGKASPENIFDLIREGKL